MLFFKESYDLINKKQRMYCVHSPPKTHLCLLYSYFDKLKSFEVFTSVVFGVEMTIVISSLFRY